MPIITRFGVFECSVNSAGSNSRPSSGISVWNVKHAYTHTNTHTGTFNQINLCASTHTHIDKSNECGTEHTIQKKNANGWKLNKFMKKIHEKRENKKKN